MPKTASLSELSAKQSPALQLALNECSLPYYAAKSVILENGQKFSFRFHEYLLDLYAETHPYIVLKKATQLGLTTWAFIKSVHDCKYRFPLGVGYFFPTKTDVTDFSQARIKPYLEYNKDLDIQDEGSVDNVGLKRIGNAYLYFRGMQSNVGMKSIPLDALVFDELDEAAPVKKEMAMQRIAHSEFKEVAELSNPTIPNYGIDKSFQMSDMRYWYLKCPHCGEWNSLDKDFPACLRNVGGNVIRACKKCKKELDLSGQGQWVADYPSKKDVRGYQFSQLFSRFVSPEAILKGYQDTANRESFMRLNLGVAFVSAENKLEKQQVMDLERAEMNIGLHDITFLGIDQGKDLHIVALKALPDGKIGLMNLIEMKNFEDIDQYIKSLRTRALVIDALPETRKAKELLMRNRGTVYMNYYNEAQKGDYKWDEDQGIVQENRTESLDVSNNLISSGRLVINKKIDPRMVELFAEHCSNIARNKETDKESGSQRYVWVKTGPDHFRHALNYAMIAMNPYLDQHEVAPQEEPYESERELVEA